MANVLQCVKQLLPFVAIVLSLSAVVINLAICHSFRGFNPSNSKQIAKVLNKNNSSIPALVRNGNTVSRL